MMLLLYYIRRKTGEKKENDLKELGDKLMENISIAIWKVA